MAKVHVGYVVLMNLLSFLLCVLQMLLDYFNFLYRYDDKVHSMHSISKKNPMAYNFSIIICDVFINMLGKLTIALSLTSKHMQMTF